MDKNSRNKVVGILFFFLLAGYGYTHMQTASVAAHSRGSPHMSAVGELRATHSSVEESGVKKSKNTATVVRVVDGDTVDVLLNGETVRVRLIGINTPETVDPRKPVECFGKEASARAKELFEGKEVQMETDPSQSLYDKYGRLLTYLFLPDGTNVNELMIREGYAHEYTYHLPYKYQQDFKAAEKEARLSARGLWAEGACIKFKS